MKDDTARVAKDVGKYNLLALWVRRQTGASSLENVMEISQKKKKKNWKNKYLTIQQFNSKVFPQRIQNIQRDTCTMMFPAAFSTTAKLQKLPKHPSTDEQIEMWYMECNIIRP